jgi:hypothetical protein
VLACINQLAAKSGQDPVQFEKQAWDSAKKIIRQMIAEMNDESVLK